MKIWRVEFCQATSSTVLALHEKKLQNAIKITLVKSRANSQDDNYFHLK